jgi:hypothetical protein
MYNIVSSTKNSTLTQGFTLKFEAACRLLEDAQQYVDNREEISPTIEFTIHKVESRYYIETYNVLGQLHNKWYADVIPSDFKYPYECQHDLGEEKDQLINRTIKEAILDELKSGELFDVYFLQTLLNEVKFMRILMDAHYYTKTEKGILRHYVVEFPAVVSTQ